MTRFDGAVAIVTGAASGVGARSVDILVEEGARVVAADIAGERLRERCAQHGDRVHCVAGDAAAAAECERMVATAVERFGGLDVVLANAGITVRAPVEDTTEEIWQRVIDTNLASLFRLARAAVPALRGRGGGAIVATASINAIRGNVELVAYSASKAGMVGIVRALAIELAPDGIRANAVCPGTIDTPMIRDYLAELPDADEVLDAMIAKHPLGRMATADDVAHAALFLASPQAAFLTGVVLPVDGGRHVR